MPTDLKAWLFRSHLFCFCIPVRAGFVLMSILTFILSGATSVIIWFELFHSYQLSSERRVAFILTGIVESLLLSMSTIGFIGVVARKQLFVMAYTYFLYIHFVLNIIVGIYFLVTVRSSNRQQLVDDCANILVNTPMESSCTRLLSVSTYVFMVIVASLLFLEFYGVLIATRYVYRLRMQKRDNRSRRLGYFHALSTPVIPGTRHTRQASDNIELLRSQDSTGDSQDPEGIIFDIQPQNYMPVSTYDHDLPPIAAPSPRSSLPPYSSLDTGSGRRIRALPPRPVGSLASPAAGQASNHSEEGAVLPEGLPNPYERRSHSPRERELQPPDSEDEQHSLATCTELSTTAHAALMDHAAYMGSIFTSTPPVANYSERPSR